jgi:FKBP-type peptidyl-prolyl cis-trans isomerase
MKKIFIVAALAASVGMSACIGSATPKSETDSVAYAIGLDLGNYIKNLDSTMNINVVAAAIKDVLANKPKMKQEDAYAFLRDYFMVRKPAKAKKASRDYLAKVAKEKDVQMTADSLLYKIVNPGSDVRAVNDYDTVKVVYHGTLKDGKVFDSSKDRGDTATFTLNRVIKGWTEGMKLVGKGGSIILWVPSELGYGEQSTGSIGPNEALKFEVDLIDVIPGKAPEEAAPSK